jgi:hypothetical protein
MALPYDPHFQFITAVKAALDDARSEIGLSWTIQKIAAMRGKSWVAGAYLSPLLGFDSPGYENVNDKITTRTLVVIVNPSELKIVSGMEGEMQKIRRVEDIFRNATMRNAPYSVKQLNSLSPDPGWRYQITRIEQADRFLSSVFSSGYDVCATVLATEFIIHRSLFNFTALGGP